MPTLDEWFEHLMQHEWGQKRISTQERRHVDYAARLQGPLGKTRLDRLTPQVIERWLHEHLDREGNRRCVQGAHDTLIAMLAIAVRQQLLPTNSAKAVRYPDAQMVTKPHRVLTMEQYRHLLAAARNRGERTILRVLCEAGLRRSELIALQVQDLDLAGGLICVQRRAYKCRDGRIDIDTPKSRKPRIVAINQTLVADLRWHLIDSGHPAKGAPIWTRSNKYTNGTTEAFTGSALMKLVQTLARHADLVDDNGKPWVTPHVLRATGASLAVAAGVSPHIAQKQLGHEHLRTAQEHYLHLPVVGPLREFGAVFE